MSGRSVLGGLVLALAAGGPALAQVSDEIIRDAAGRYRISDGAHSCTVTLKAEPSIGGYEADGGKGCWKIDPRLADIGVWSIEEGGGIGFSDTMRHHIASFAENEGGPYTLDRPGGKQWTLSALDTRELSPAEKMRGGWNVIVDARQVCAYDFTSNAAGTGGAIRLRAGCDAKWAGRGLTRWRVQGDKILLGGADGKPAMTLRRTDPITFSGMLYGNVRIDLMKEVP